MQVYAFPSPAIANYKHSSKREKKVKSTMGGAAVLRTLMTAAPLI